MMMDNEKSLNLYETSNKPYLYNLQSTPLTFGLLPLALNFWFLSFEPNNMSHIYSQISKHIYRDLNSPYLEKG